MTEWDLLSLLVGFVLPLLVAIVTKQSWSSNVKAVLLAGLSAASGFLIEAMDAGGLFVAGFDWRGAVFNVAVAWVMAVATYFGYWKPTGIAGKFQQIGVRDRPASTTYRHAA